MNFFKIKTSWSNAELGIFKVCIACVFVMIGVFFNDFLKNFYMPLIVLFVITLVWTLYLWITKMRNRN